MSYTMAQGRLADTEDTTLRVSSTSTATGNDTINLELGDRACLRLFLDVTAASGTTPTLDVTVEGSRDGSTWYTLGTFAQKTAVSTERKSFPCDRFVRTRRVIGGTTPSFTYSITGEAA